MSEAYVRKVLRKKDIILKKDRARNWSWNHNGGFMVIGFTDYYHDMVILAGETYDLTLDDVIEKYVLK